MPKEEKKDIAIIIAYTIIIILLIFIIFILLTKEDKPKEETKSETDQQTELKDEQNEIVDNAWATVDAVRIAYAKAQTGSEPVILPYKVNFPKGNTKGKEGVDWGNDESVGGTFGKGYINDIEVKPTGSLPEEGSVTVQENFDIIAYKLKFGDYYCSTINENDKSTFDPESMICSKNEIDVEIVNYDH